MVGGLTIGIGAFLAYTTVQWWASWYPGAEPGGGGYVAQRMMSAKTEKDAVYATLFFQIGHYCLRPWPWILVALATMVLYPDLEDPKMGYVMAMRDFLPDGLRGLLLVAFLAAYMSTISTQLNWGAGYLVNDFYKRFMKPNKTDKHYVSMSRLVTILLVIVGGIATTFMTSISGVWQFIMECGAGLGLVLILRWYWWRINAWSEIVATVMPFIIYTFLQLFAPDIVFPNGFFIIVSGTTLSWIIATIVTKPTDSDVLKSFYETVQPEGAWKPIQKISSVEFKASGIWRLVICWLSGIVFTYSILFSTGYVIFGNWDAFMIWFPLAVISLIILIITLRKTSILD
jgi:SSS family solute:Na+ symporter